MPKVLKLGYHDFFELCNVERFVDELIKLENKMKYYFDHTNIPLKRTEEVEEKFVRVTDCWLCNQPFTPLSLVIDMKGMIRNHCHLTCRYRGAAHNVCNTNAKLPKKPVNFHNLSGYDSHLFFRRIVAREAQNFSSE